MFSFGVIVFFGSFVGGKDAAQERPEGRARPTGDLERELQREDLFIASQTQSLHLSQIYSTVLPLVEEDPGEEDAASEELQ